jgi:Rhodopirellula transposase DDE domain
VLGVDTKKKEVLGEYAVAGQQWHRAGQPIRVRAHDFPDKSAQKVVPDGIDDLAADSGWVWVGCDGDTAAFAVATLRRCWDGEGRHRYPAATRLLITADAGGANGYRVRAWNKELAGFATRQAWRCWCVTSRRARPSGTSRYDLWATRER